MPQNSGTHIAVVAALIVLAQAYEHSDCGEAAAAPEAIPDSSRLLARKRTA